MNEELKRRAELASDRIGAIGSFSDAAVIRDLIRTIAELEQFAEPLSMSMFASRKDYDEAVAQRAEQPQKLRPDFIAGYDAGLADGKRCAERTKINQCAETCERAKMCAICAGPITEQPKPEPVATVKESLTDDDWKSEWDGLTYIGPRKTTVSVSERVSTPEPVAEIVEDMKGGGSVRWLTDEAFVHGTKLYTAPPKPATDETNRPDVEAVRSGRAVAISQSALETLRKRSIPAGYVLVPIEFTKEHFARLLGRELLNMDRTAFEQHKREYAAYLAAAPKVQP